MNEIIKQKLVDIISETGYMPKMLTAKKHDKEMYIRLYGQDSVKAKKFYNISAGGHFDFGCGIHHPCWTNIDYDRNWKSGKRFDPKKDISHDILSCKTIPIESNSAELVHCRLSIEHITDEAALFMFSEVKRILKKGGIFRVVTVNIDLDYRAFKENDRDYFFWFHDFKAISIEQAFLEHFAASASTLVADGSKKRISDEEIRMIFNTKNYTDALNYCTSHCEIELQNKYRNRHMNWWNHDKLKLMLTAAGFKYIYMSSPEQSVAPVLRNEYYFDNICNKALLHMETINN